MTQARRAARLAFHTAVGIPTLFFYLCVVVPWSRCQRTWARRRGRRPRILWGAVPIINIRYSSLADKQYGYSSRTVVNDLYVIDARDDYDELMEGRLAPYRAFVRAGFDTDIFGFFFDGGLLARTPWWSFELWLVRAAGKAILVYPYGGDARLPSATRALGDWNAYSLVRPGCEDRDERDVRRHLARFAARANFMLGCADLAASLPRLDGMMPFPFDDRDWKPVAATPGDSVVVVHAPNHRHYKGTQFLIEAIDALRSDGVTIELDLVERLPRTMARERYARAHIVADQFLIGGYAMFAIESMALGKPVLCYLPERLRVYHPEWDECPIVSANPDTLYERLRELALDRELREALGARGPAYVRKYHSLHAIGALQDSLYRRMWP